VVTLDDGRVLRNRVAVNRGNPDLPLSNPEIEAKYFENCAVSLDRATASRIRDAILGLESIGDVRELEALLAAEARAEAAA